MARSDQLHQIRKISPYYSIALLALADYAGVATLDLSTSAVNVVCVFIRTALMMVYTAMIFLLCLRWGVNRRSKRAGVGATGAAFVLVMLAV
ncbi:MAG: hypothetical protein U5L01_07730 [Rheinheimera sp.]|nr:hypothetical protein [Rheinheimera sp.]